MRITLAVVMAAVWVAAFGETPTYLYAQLPLPQGAVAALPDRAQTAGVPLARAAPDGTLSFVGANSEEELLSSELYLFVDGDFFLLGYHTGDATDFLRGGPTVAELIALGNLEALSRFIGTLDQLGLLPPEAQVELSPRMVSLKIPAPLEGVRLDPVLWGLLVSPDWFAFARDYGLERVGLRVRVVAEVTGLLPEAYEPYIRSSSEKLVELLIPIPLLDDLGREPMVVLVRPPYRPQPAAPVRP